MHAALHGVDVGHGGEVQIFPPNERRELLEKVLPERLVSGSNARLDQRRPLPILAEALVVG
ncbi:hypothetical protein AUC70_08825 [Methyloceanibacter stevinii]|uniref:Uncharacterized protein n=1 Tax=Methyloceanibacter stevinii TaxID=1774970 RepID=A0A1E3VN22_9HYPH|nr:hypothetical protein AUC70_08825 [Methyloceanibacter stevinii]